MFYLFLVEVRVDKNLKSHAGLHHHELRARVYRIQVFTIMNYLLPKQGIVSMHASANAGKEMLGHAVKGLGFRV